MAGRDHRTTTQKGYGATHQRYRRRWARLLEREGELPCARCGAPVTPTTPWDLDHDDVDRSRYIGVSHRVCNQRAGGQKAQRTRVTRWAW